MRNRSPIRSYGREATSNSRLLASVVCVAILGSLLATSSALLHWFVIPVTLCGILTAEDATDWLRARVDLFDPAGLIGLLGVYFFFLTPLLLVSLGQGLDVQYGAPSDWRPWLGRMAILNCLGLILYRFVLNLNHAERPPSREIWKLDRVKWMVAVATALVVSATLQLWVYRYFGGLGHYLEAVNDPQGRGEAFEGFGSVFLLSESFPLIAAMGFATYAARSRYARTWPALALALSVFLLLELFFGGLRGSRSTTVWALFWIVGLIHLRVRPIPRKVLFAGLIGVFLPFMYVYGFYKARGLDGVAIALSGTEARARLAESSGRTWQGVLLGDLGRSDVQALVLERIVEARGDHEYAWGRTYAAAAALLVPRTVFPQRPDGKVKEGTELIFGRGAYVPSVLASSKVYGLAGEAMLNFGPVAVPFVFLPLALLVRAVRRRLTRWRHDARGMMLPMLVGLCLVMLVSDSDNVVFYLVKTGGLPVLMVLVSKRRVIRWSRQPSVRVGDVGVAGCRRTAIGAIGVGTSCAS